MRDVSIQRVTNGWIVQDTDTSRVGPDDTFVYTRIEELTAALPNILGVPSPRPPVELPEGPYRDDPYYRVFGVPPPPEPAPLEVTCDIDPAPLCAADL